MDMIKLEVRCPRCKRKQKYVNYRIKKLYQIYGKKRRCVACGKMFYLKNDKEDNIVKVLTVL